MPLLLKRRTVIPGFGLTFGLTMFYLSLVVLIPLSTVFLKTFSSTWPEFCDAAFSPQALAAYKLSLGASTVGALVNAVFGLVVAWVLVRCRFPGASVVDALVDLPFALPTAVAGIALTTIYSKNGWIGSLLSRFGIEAAFTPLGVTIALIFIGIPFVVRTVQPVIQELDREYEDAAASLGASRWQTFAKVILPTLWPALLTGFALAFARALGEYGSVVFISGNIPLKTEIAPLLIMKHLEEYDYEGATAVAVVMLAMSFALLLAINLLQRWSRRWQSP